MTDDTHTPDDWTDDLAALADVLGGVRRTNQIRQANAASFDAAARYFNMIMKGPHLDRRMKELLLVALHASASTVNGEGVRRHIARAFSAGASAAEVLDTLLIIVGVGNHALYFAVPILMEELGKAGHPDRELPELNADALALKDDFIATRGFWNDGREQIARLAPDYFEALSKLSMTVWETGALSPKHREFICIAIDCAVSHPYAPGLAMHIRHALSHGATRDEIMEVFQLAALTGVEGLLFYSAGSN